MIVSLLIICLFLTFLHYYIINFRGKGRLINRIPGDIPFPIVGNILKYFWHSPEKLWLSKCDYLRTYYPICKIWLFSIPFINICHPDDMQKVLSSMKNNEKSFVYKYFHPWVGDCLATSNGKKWQKRRKMLTPAFHFSMLKQFTEILIEEGHRIVEYFNHTEESTIKDLQSFIGHHSINAICETSMGISLENLGPFKQQYCQAVHDMFYIIIQRFSKPWLLSDTIFSLTSLSNKQTKCLNILHSFTEKVIAERKQYHEQTGGRYLKCIENDTETEDAEMIGIRRKRMAMLDILIAESLKNELSDLDIREEVDIFMLGGYDTIAMGISFSLALLAEHKDIQDRVRDEISNVMQKNDGKLTMSALQDLSYLERCLKESLRMYPGGPMISRVPSEDIKLHSYLVPEGTTLVLHIYELHHDPNFWPNPEVFDPDRFLPENVKNRHPYAYLPFSAGPRNCIGHRFAMLELKALIAPLVYNFYLEPIDYLKDVTFKLSFELCVSRPIRMKVIPIKRA